jgi:hypothetical protein
MMIIYSVVIIILIQSNDRVSRKYSEEGYRRNYKLGEHKHKTHMVKLTMKKESMYGTQNPERS